MDVTSIGQAPTSKAEVQIETQKKVTDQQAKATQTIIDSVTQEAPQVEPTKGQNLAVYA